MIDILFVRNNQAKFDEMMRNRGAEPCANKILLLDQERCKLIQNIQNLQQQKNILANKMVNIFDILEKENLIAESKNLSEQLESLKEKLDTNELGSFLETIPNILSDRVPIGKSSEDNIPIRSWGQPNQLSFDPKHHYELGTGNGFLDFERTAVMCGNRFSTLRGSLAKLERVLINFMIEHHISKYGFIEHSTPYLVKPRSMFGTGQLPKFASDAFYAEGDYYLIPTGEVPLLNFFRDQIVKNLDRPIRVTACTPCFRKEAGSTGSDTRGMIRQHQFTKVEMVSIASAESSYQELEVLVEAAESLLKALKLPYRTISLCTGDTGFSSAFTYDIEVWLPSQNSYREISSCSNCEDFQARRMKIRHKSAGKNLLAHTLNGSGLAIGRTIAAILENYQQKDGSIAIPEVLQESMGSEFLSKFDADH